jgi:hypothetical protein
MTPHPDNEIVVAMSQGDFDALCNVLYRVAANDAEADKAHQRLLRSATTLTLEWLDRKLEEFP